MPVGPECQPLLLERGAPDSSDSYGLAYGIARRVVTKAPNTARVFAGLADPSKARCMSPWTAGD